jgi:predicted small lipoprotein YifL
MSRPADPETTRCRRPAVVRIAALLLVATALMGCGRKAPPVPPPGEPVTYPKQYPTS